MNYISRLSFLRALGGAGLAAAAGCVTRSRRHQGHIDAHAHVWPSDTARYPLSRGMTKGNCVEHFTPQRLFAHCRAEGVTRAVLIQMSFFKFDNRYMLDAIERYPGVFSGVGVVNERGADVSNRMKELIRGGVRGFRIHAGSERDPGKWLGTEGMAKMWRVAADQGVSICPLINPDALPYIGKMCEKYPRTSVVIDHFARIGCTGAITQSALEPLLRLSEYPHVHLKASAFYALGEKQPPYLDLGPMIRTCRDHYGAHRMMWASDSPFQVGAGHTYHDSIALIRDRLDFLSSEDKAWLLRRSAEKLFFA